MDCHKTKDSWPVQLAGGLAASAVLLTVMQAPWNAHFLAWVAWVPFVLACAPGTPTKRLLVWAYLASLGYWLFNLWWLTPVTIPGYVVFCLYQSLYGPILALCVQWVRRKGWALTLFAPVIFAGAEAIQGNLFGGFSWFFLSHSQYQQLPLIQICDIFGALGVSVLVAMVNGLAADGLIEWSRRPRWGWGFAKKAALTMVCLWTAVGYGFYRIAQTPKFVTDGPVIGSVQPNVPSFVKEETENAQELLDGLIEKSQACIDAGAALVAWPETMVLTTMNPGYLVHCSPSSEPRQFQQQILHHAEGQAYILFGANSATVGSDFKITDQFNSAFLYRPDGTADLQRYDKIHLVPFGEFIPFRNSLPWIYRMIMLLSPYDYDYNLTPGQTYTIFNIDDHNKAYRFGVLICYEDTHPTVTRKMVTDENGVKRADWLVNISNDGWYVWYRDGKVAPSAELTQRMAISVFRCIENRIAIVRSVNTGISCLIDSTGRIHNNFQNGTLPKAASDRQGVDGWFTDRVPIDSRVTAFGRYGRWLEGVFGTGFVGVLAWTIMEHYKNRRKGVRK